MITDRYSNDFLIEIKTLLSEFNDLRTLNGFLRNKTGVLNFFKSKPDYVEFKQFLDNPHIPIDTNHDLGDFQTPSHLTDKICEYVMDTGFSPDAIVEPTCGEGNFVVSAIKYFSNLKYVYCVDIQSIYEWLFKLKILKVCFEGDMNLTIEFHRDNIFSHRVSGRFMRFLNGKSKNLLILGNPPWITSAGLSILNSANIPVKSNIKKHKGIEAITGKSNFDIAEYIVLRVLQLFSSRGKIAMLCKTSVIKNIVRDLAKLSLELSDIRALLIDAKKEFNVNADAALFMADLNSTGNTFCTVSSFYQPHNVLRRYGWIKEKFVSDVKLYGKYGFFDGKSPLEWRQGVKHDASKVMILRVTNRGLMNGLQEYLEVEEEALYPFVRGSKLKQPVIRDADNKIIITQKSPNEDTAHLAFEYPKLWEYLISHAGYLDRRRSKIYKKRPRFSIFGIGGYSFLPYRVAVSGLYKDARFSLVFPIHGKSVMIDDTSYHLSFGSFNNAFFTWILLNTEEVKGLLNSIVFLDSKRPYSKEMLMRIDLLKLVNNISFDHIIETYAKKLKNYGKFKFKEMDFIKYKDFLNKKATNHKSSSNTRH